MNDTTTFEEQIGDLHAQAQGRYQEGDMQGARQIWEAILQMNPGDPRAEEGLRLTSLADANWALVEQSAGSAPERTARIAEIREALGSGLAGDAVRLAEELAKTNPADPEVQELLESARQALETSSLVSAALTDAREALSRGDQATAGEACRRVLELDPSNREATMLLEQAQGLGGGTGPVTGAMAGGGEAGADLDLDLDLDLLSATPPPTPAPPPGQAAPREEEPALDLELDLSTAPKRPARPTPAKPPAPPASPPAAAADDPVSVADLFDAADEIASTGAVPETPTATSPETAGQGEAALLVSRARGELQAGNLEAATQLASQAMALDESITGADQILDEARSAMRERGERAESLLVEASARLDADDAAAAVPMLEQALALVPNHPEVVELLERARSAAGVPAPTPDSPVPDAPDFGDGAADLASIPLAGGAPASPPASDIHGSPPAPPPPVGGAPGGAPTPPPPVGDAPAPPPPVGEAPAPPPVSLDDAPPALEAPPPISEGASAPAGRRGKARRKRSTGGSSIGRLLVAVLALVAVGAGGWYGYQWWTSRQSTDDDAALAGLAIEVPTPLPDNRGTPGEDGVGSVEMPAAEPESGPAPPSAPRYEKRDIPRLLARARRATSEGHEEEALELLAVAQDLDPTNFEILDEMQATRARLRERRSAQERIETGRRAFADGAYEEALRIFYRIPKEYQPAAIERWIANGWYNLGVQSLVNGDVVEASRFFADALELSPGDPDALRHREVARRYRRRGIDDAYRLYVSRLELRSLGD